MLTSPETRETETREMLPSLLEPEPKPDHQETPQKESDEYSDFLSYTSAQPSITTPLDLLKVNLSQLFNSIAIQLNESLESHQKPTRSLLIHRQKLFHFFDFILPQYTLSPSFQQFTLGLRRTVDELFERLEPLVEDSVEDHEDLFKQLNHNASTSASYTSAPPQMYYAKSHHHSTPVTPSGGKMLLLSCPYDGCNEVLTSKSAYHAHLRTHDVDQRPFLCLVPGCNQRFARKAYLVVHERTHTGDRPYECKVPACGKRFTQKSALNSHCKTVHQGRFE